MSQIIILFSHAGNFLIVLPKTIIFHFSIINIQLIECINVAVFGLAKTIKLKLKTDFFSQVILLNPMYYACFDPTFNHFKEHL